jgi:catechol 2,3-dioxygenase-like lactoylglutathione lyase family enzyme
MAKLRHIAYRAQDVESMAQFFVKTLELSIVQRRANGAIDLSDGTINITVLPMVTGTSTGHERPGVNHIGFSVANDDAAGRAMEAAGAQQIGRIGDVQGAHYELKFKGPEGIVVDIGHWIGAAPIEDEARV